MTLHEFQKKVIKNNWYDKYYFYLLSTGIFGTGVFFIYDLMTNAKKYGDRTLPFYSLAIFFILLGAYAFYRVPRRYKILSIDSSLDISKKKNIMVELITKLDVSYYDTDDTYFTFCYQRKWWTQDMNVYLNADNEKFYISVVGRTHGKGGFIDFGSSENLRKKIISIIIHLTQG